MTRYSLLFGCCVSQSCKVKFFTFCLSVEEMHEGNKLFLFLLAMLAVPRTA